MKSIKILFYIASLYDGLLGFIFCLFPLAMFNWFNVTPPNHNGYVQFPALLLLIFGIMFFNIAKNPQKNRNLIPYGILLKASYSGIVLGYWFTINIPNMWKPFAIMDFIFGILFYLAYKAIDK